MCPPSILCFTLALTSHSSTEEVPPMCGHETPYRQGQPAHAGDEVMEERLEREAALALVAEI